jgi:hypothetical protein
VWEVHTRDAAAADDTHFDPLTFRRLDFSRQRYGSNSSDSKRDTLMAECSAANRKVHASNPKLTYDVLIQFSTHVIIPTEQATRIPSSNRTNHRRHRRATAVAKSAVKSGPIHLDRYTWTDTPGPIHPGLHARGPSRAALASILKPKDTILQSLNTDALLMVDAKK